MPQPRSDLELAPLRTRHRLPDQLGRQRRREAADEFVGIAPAESCWATATRTGFTHVLTRGPNTRLEFHRNDAESLVDVELSREAWTALRGRIGLRPGSAAHLKLRRITRFQETADDPAATI